MKKTELKKIIREVINEQFNLPNMYFSLHNLDDAITFSQDPDIYPGFSGNGSVPDFVFDVCQLTAAPAGPITDPQSLGAGDGCFNYAISNPTTDELESFLPLVGAEGYFPSGNNSCEEACVATESEPLQTESCKAIFAKSCDESPVDYYLPCALMGPSIQEWQASGEALNNLPGSTPQVGDTFHLLQMFGGPKDYKVTEVISPNATIVQVMPAAVNPEACSESSNTDVDTDSGIDDSDTDPNPDDFSGGPGGGPSPIDLGLDAAQSQLSVEPSTGGPTPYKKPQRKPSKGDIQKDRMKKLANIKPNRKK